MFDLIKFTDIRYASWIIFSIICHFGFSLWAHTAISLCLIPFEGRPTSMAEGIQKIPTIGWRIDVLNSISYTWRQLLDPDRKSTTIELTKHILEKSFYLLEWVRRPGQRHNRRSLEILVKARLESAKIRITGWGVLRKETPMLKS